MKILSILRILLTRKLVYWPISSIELKPKVRFFVLTKNLFKQTSTRCKLELY